MSISGSLCPRITTGAGLSPSSRSSHAAKASARAISSRQVSTRLPLICAGRSGCEPRPLVDSVEKMHRVKSDW